MDAAQLREAFRSLRDFRNAYEEFGIDQIGEGEASLSLWDLEHAYEMTHMLSRQQRRAIEYCLVQGLRERDAAILMGVSPTNPVSSYANDGCARLVALMAQGKIRSIAA